MRATRIRDRANLPGSLLAAVALAACLHFPTLDKAGIGYARSQAGEGVPGHVADERLKTMYLRCSSAALQNRIGLNGNAACSVIYETLLQRVFGGDFLALLAWSREQRHDQDIADYIEPMDRGI